MVNDKKPLFYTLQNIGKNKIKFSVCTVRGVRQGTGAVGAEWSVNESHLCATHLSRVPQSSVWGCHLLSFCLFDYFVIKVYVYGLLVPVSFFPELWTVLYWCRNPGGRRDTLSEGPRRWGNVRCMEGAESVAVDEPKKYRIVGIRESILKVGIDPIKGNRLLIQSHFQFNKAYLWVPANRRLHILAERK